jgi:rod shape-determining protein MreB
VRGHPDIAVDLGTTNTLVYVRGRGIVLSEPSLVAVRTETRRVCAVGADAEQLLGRSVGSMTGFRPIRNGVITDFDLAVEMLQRFIRKACRRRRVHPHLLVAGVPTGATSVERRAVQEACLAAGVRDTRLIEEPMAAAIGAGLPVADPAGSLVVDFGGGTTEVALISLGEMVVWQSIRHGAEQLDEAIVRYLKREREVLISEQVAEEVKILIGSVFPADQDARVEVSSFDTRSALPKTSVLTSEEIRGALERPITRIIDTVKETLGRTPPELASDIMDRGIMLTGGGSLLKGLPERLREETQMPAYVAELPLTCVAAGSGAWLEERGQERGQVPPALGVSGPVTEPDRRALSSRRARTARPPLEVQTPRRVSDAGHTTPGAPAPASGRETAEEVIARAGADADAMLQRAARQARETLEAAQVDATETRKSAEREADQIRADARRQSEEMLASANSASSQLARDAEAMLREWRRLMGDARVAGEQLITVGERRLLERLREVSARRRSQAWRRRRR